ncbi:anthranilate phosphoribosyltransferase [Enterococcus nangangensis]|uniref:anthranilate phosphoribosyltransferase n=1 Tax=Enterococcus nangangensis TaxID=2559926 RepID=UPI0010F5A85F|nr:anthranilate phosphoribosyltransferase [Enterococcus nangangensis]
MTAQTALEKIYQNENLNTQEMTALATALFSGELTDAQIAALMIGLKIKGASVDELTALASVMQQKAIPMFKAPAGVMDNCGTGGDHSNSFNISTTSAFVLAGAGIPMAKHGNRSISSKAGSADVLEALGVTLNVSPAGIDYLLAQAHIAFLFAPALHPAMKYVMKIRRELATPTIFNLIGPLINPYPLDNQLLGTSAGASLKETAAALGQLGRKRAIVIHGAYGMDEANLSGATHCALYENQQVQTFDLDPQEYGFTPCNLKEIQGGDAERNKEILLSVLNNEPSPYLETVVLNAGLGLYAGGVVPDFAAGFTKAREIIANGLAQEALTKLLRYQKEVA